jgi:hypothetical protein
MTARLIALEQPGGVAEELGRRGQVVVGVAGLPVPEVGRKPRQPDLDVVAFAIPAEQGAHGEGLAQIMDPRGMRRPGADAGFLAQHPERRPDALVDDPRAAQRDEEALAGGARAEPISLAGVVAERL